MKSGSSVSQDKHLEEYDNKGSELRKTLMSSLQKEIATSRAFRFKEYLISEIEKILASRPACIDDAVQRIKIVDVIFAFKNSMMINTLIKRGSFIMNSKNKELIEIEH